ncbi:hypothetical protein COO60DRAFT_715515 [Scenedesmus sp. NREL 46B-D3]|nr:hypothetical protein COO60DRAFT_715515 [Scenedesmus sp. NREL 46B-D3]
MLSWYDNARAGSCNDAQSMSVLAPCSTSGFVYAPVKPEGPPVFCLQEHATMNARGKLAADIVGYFFSVISPQTRDRGPFLIQQEVDGTKTVRLTIRPLHANASIGTPHHTVSANSRDETHARQLVSLQMLQHLETQGVLPDDWWRWTPGWLHSAEPHVLRFIMLAHLLTLKEHCWVARKSVIKSRISAEARSVVEQVLDALLQEGSVVENSQQQVRLATTQEFSLHQHAPRKQQRQQRPGRHEMPPPRVAEAAGYQQQPYAAAAAPADHYAPPDQHAGRQSPPPSRYGRSSSRDELYMQRRDGPPTPSSSRSSSRLHTTAMHSRRRQVLTTGTGTRCRSRRHRLQSMCYPGVSGSRHHLLLRRMIMAGQALLHITLLAAGSSSSRASAVTSGSLSARVVLTGVTHTSSGSKAMQIPTASARRTASHLPSSRCSSSL